MRIFTGDWISWRKKAWSKSPITDINNWKAVSLFGEKTTSYSTPPPPRGENTGAKGKGGKIKSQKTVSLDFCTFWALTSKSVWNSTLKKKKKTWGKVNAVGYIDHGRNVFLCRNNPIKNLRKQLGEGGASSLLTPLSFPFAVCFCLSLDHPWILALPSPPPSCVYKVPSGSCQLGGGKAPTNSGQLLQSCQVQLE